MSTGNRLDVVDVAGGMVLRPFTRGTERLPRGYKLSREEVLSIPANTREALISSQALREYARAPGEVPSGGQRFVVRNASDPKLYDVVVGARLNTEPLTRDKAEALAREGLT
jgi:hypothetical protein